MSNEERKNTNDNTNDEAVMITPPEGEHQDIEFSTNEDTFLSTKIKKERSLKSRINFSNRHKKERVRDVKCFLIRHTNPASLVGSTEYKSQCEYVLEDVMQSL